MSESPMQDLEAAIASTRTIHGDSLDPHDAAMLADAIEGLIVMHTNRAESEFYNSWNPMEIAPKDRVIFACDTVHGYTAKVIAAHGGLEWECVDFRDKPTGVGFYPTHWHLIGKLPEMQAQSTTSPPPS